MRGRNLDAVEARLLNPDCGLGEVGDDAADILDLDRLAVAAMYGLAQARGRYEMPERLSRPR